MGRWWVVLLFCVTGCGPLGIGAGAADLFGGDDPTDPISPDLQLEVTGPEEEELRSPAYVSFHTRPDPGGQPRPTTRPVTFRITPNKQGVTMTALVRGPAFDVPLALSSVPGTLSMEAELRPDQVPADEDGSVWTLLATGRDRQGRTAEASFELTIDRVGPRLGPIPRTAQAREAGTVLLEWLPTAEPGVTGYRVYEARGGTRIPDLRTTRNVYDRVHAVPGDEWTAAFTVQGLPGTRAHYFQVVAVDAAGNESALAEGAELRVVTRSGGTGLFGTPGPLNTLGGDWLEVAAADDTMQRLEVADLNGNARPDYVIGAEEAIYVVFDDGEVRTLPQAAPDYRFRIGRVGIDRTPDILVASRTALRLYEGPAFATPGTASVNLAGTVLDLAIADLDEDGLGDFVALVDTGFGTLQQVRWFRQVRVTGGALEFATVEFTPFVANENTPAFALADVDGDRTLDIAMAVEQAILVRRGELLAGGGNGYGHAAGAAEAFIGAGGSALAVHAVDMTGDGLADFVCPLADGRVSVIENRGLKPDGTLDLVSARVSRVGLDDLRVAFGDFNADGLPDVAAVEPARGRVTVLLSERGSADFRVAQVFTTEGVPRDIAVTDRNGDGLLDLALVTDRGGLEFWSGHGSTGRGDGGFHPTDSVFSVNLAIGPAADLDGDGITDFVAAAVDQGYTIVTFLGEGWQGQGAGRLVTGPASANLTSAFRTGLAIGDVDDNGEFDVVAASVENVEIHTRHGTTFQRSQVNGLPQEGFVRVPVLADLDRDRYDDLLLPQSDGTVLQFRSQGGALFFCSPGIASVVGYPPAGCDRPAPVALPFPATHRNDALAVGDVDGDGRRDLASFDAGTGLVSVQLGDARGAFPASTTARMGVKERQSVAGAGDPAVLVVRDLDGDGHADLLAALGDRGRTDEGTVRGDGVSIAFGLGSGAFGDAEVLWMGPDATVREVHPADIDRDGRLDLIVVEDRRTRVLLQTAARVFGSAVTTDPLPARARFSGTNVAVLDVDGDGIADLVASDEQSSESRVWQGTGTVVRYPPDG